MICPPDGATSTRPIRQVATLDRRNSSGGIPPRRGKCPTIGPYITTHAYSDMSYPMNIHQAHIQLYIVWHQGVDTLRETEDNCGEGATKHCLYSPWPTCGDTYHVYIHYCKWSHKIPFKYVTGCLLCGNIIEVPAGYVMTSMRMISVIG